MLNIVILVLIYIKIIFIVVRGASDKKFLKDKADYFRVIGSVLTAVLLFFYVFTFNKPVFIDAMAALGILFLVDFALSLSKSSYLFTLSLTCLLLGGVFLPLELTSLAEIFAYGCFSTMVLGVLKEVLYAK